MADFLPYLTVLITGALAIGGIFYSKAGEKASIRTIGYVFLCLTIASTIASLYQVYLSKQSSASASAKIARLLEDNRKLQAAVDGTAWLQSLGLIDLNAKVTYGVFSLDYAELYDYPEDAEPPPSNRGNVPAFFKAFYWDGSPGLIARLNFSTGEISEIDFEFIGLPGRKLEIKRVSEPSASVFTSEDAAPCLYPTSGMPSECPDMGPPGHGDWFSDFIAGLEADGVILIPNESAQKLLSDLKRTESFGSLEYPTVSDAQFAAIETIYGTKIKSELKIYVNTKDKGDKDCPNAVWFPIELETGRTSTGGARINFKNSGASQITLCEENPI